jgi:hypothetical protein
MKTGNFYAKIINDFFFKHLDHYRTFYGAYNCREKPTPLLVEKIRSNVIA